MFHIIFEQYSGILFQMNRRILMILNFKSSNLFKTSITTIKSFKYHLLALQFCLILFLVIYLRIYFKYFSYLITLRRTFSSKTLIQLFKKVKNKKLIQSFAQNFIYILEHGCESVFGDQRKFEVKCLQIKQYKISVVIPLGAQDNGGEFLMQLQNEPIGLKQTLLALGTQSAAIESRYRNIILGPKCELFIFNLTNL
ncbi:hypothetical protein pb186bvf_003226 [Paramecium bursaria]